MWASILVALVVCVGFYLFGMIGALGGLVVGYFGSESGLLSSRPMGQGIFLSRRNNTVNPVALLLQSPVAFAGSFFQSLTIKDRERRTLVLDQLLSL